MNRHERKALARLDKGEIWKYSDKVFKEWQRLRKKAREERAREIDEILNVKIERNDKKGTN